MNMNIEIAAVRITREIHEAEHALTEALIKQSNLFTSMLTARRDTEVGTFAGQDALLRLAASQQSLLSAGNDLARVHGKLRDIATETGTLGDYCPPSQATLDTPTPLALAA